MRPGKARNILVKMLLFKMAQQLGIDICFRCGEKLDVSSLSIDHKLPWLHTSSDLYWDLDNIAFSHNGCNSRAARRTPENINKMHVARKSQVNRDYRSGPPGTAWCVGHQDYILRECFNKNKSRPDGLQKYCKKCRSLGIGRYAGKYYASVTQTAECLSCKEDVAGATPASSPISMA